MVGYVAEPLIGRGIGEVLGSASVPAGIGVNPVDEVGTAQDPDALRQLIEHSSTVGTLDERFHGSSRVCV